jgi:hypothetical protein
MMGMEDVEFLAEPNEDGMCQRVELNAMSSPPLETAII